MFFRIFMYRCERNNNNNNVPTMQTEMENGKYCDNGNTVETELKWAIGTDGRSYSADRINIWLTNDAASRQGVVNDHRNVK